MFSNKKLLTGALSLFVLAWIGQVFGLEELSLTVQKAYAVGTGGNPTTEIFNGMTAVLGIFITVINFLAFLVYPLIEVILEPRFFLQIHAANEVTILQIWRVSRDIVNVIFAFMLVVGACLTVVTAKKDIISKYAIKFVLAVILVNFSWFFPRVILDVGHVLAATVYQLPRMVGTTCMSTDINGNIQPVCEYPVRFAYFDEAQAMSPSPPTGWKCPLEIFCYETSSLSNNTNTASGIISGLIFNHGRLPHLAQVPNLTGGGAPSSDPLDQISFFLMFIVNAFFLMGLSFTLLLAMLALMVAFLIRIPILWMTMAFMPFMFVGFVIEDKMGNFNTMKIFEHFVKAAFLPAVTAIPLSVGFIVINAIAFSPAPPAAMVLETSLGHFLPGVGNLWVLLWQITVVLIIWHGFWMALSIDSIYTKSTSAIRGFGGSVGTLAATLPLNVPILPAPKDEHGNTIKGADGKDMPAMTLGQASMLPGGLKNLSRRGQLNKDQVLGLLGRGQDNVSAASQSLQGSDAVRNAVSSNNMTALATTIKNLDSNLKSLTPDKQYEAMRRALQGMNLTLSPSEHAQLKTELGVTGGGRGTVSAPGSGAPPPSAPPTT